MRTPGMITLSAPIETSSPIATPSCTRTCERRSQARPTIAPSRTVLRPMYVDASTIVRDEVRLAVLVEVADVLPVAVEHVAVHRPAHLEQQREELLREVVRPVGRDVVH